MFVAAAIVSGLLAAALIASARGKLVKDKNVIDVMTKVEFPLDKLWLLAAAELAGTADSWPVCSGGRSGSPPRSA